MTSLQSAIRDTLKLFALNHQALIKAGLDTQITGNLDQATTAILKAFRDALPKRADGMSPDLYGNYFDGYNAAIAEVLALTDLKEEANRG